RLELYDARDGLVVLPSLASVDSIPHTSQLNTRAVEAPRHGRRDDRAGRGRGRGGRDRDRGRRDQSQRREPEERYDVEAEDETVREGISDEMQAPAEAPADIDAAEQP